MAKTTAQDAVIDRRRARVAELAAQRKTQREIAEMLAAEGLINPETEQAWSLGTINADLQTVRKSWQRDAKQALGTLRAEMLAEVNEVKRAAWRDNNYALVLKGIETQAGLLGLNRPGTLDDLIDTEINVRITRVDSRKEPPTRRPDPTPPAE